MCSQRALRAVICLILIIGVSGCGRVPATNTIAVQAQRPDGQLSAILVKRELKVALSADEFFLILVPHKKNVDEAISESDIGDSAAFVATSADKVRLQWLNNDTLIVECNSCGLKPIDIEKKVDQVAQTRIAYRGFPRGTAYE